MKIATFNINNIRRRLPNLVRWLEAAKPDIVSLQELKCTDAEFPEEALQRAGYHAVWRGQKSWNGVAILSRRGEPVVTNRTLPGDATDTQARYIEAAVQGLLIGCIYLPNGNPQPGPKFDYKLAWFERLSAHARDLLEQNLPVVLAGDFNVAPTAADIYDTSSWDRDALIQLASRRAFARLVQQGWTDAIRERHPNQRIYTFWHYMRRRYERDAGLRIDHLLLSPAVALRLRSAAVDKAIRGEDGASDHAPTWIALAANARGGRAPARAGSGASRAPSPPTREQQEWAMPRGDKSRYTDKQARKAEHIEESCERRGVPKEEAERRAWATVNKDDGGAKKPGGSGRGKETGHPAAQKGGAASASRSAADRSASAKKAAATRKRNAATRHIAAT